MKKYIFVIAFLGTITAGANGSQPQTHDCVMQGAQMLNLQVGQVMKATGKNSQGNICDISIRHRVDQPGSEALLFTAYNRGEHTSFAMAQLKSDDRVNEWDMQTCDLGNDHMTFAWEEKESAGEQRTFTSNVQIQLKDGHISEMAVQHVIHGSDQDATRSVDCIIEN